ncbi:hypothetical protein [Xylanibacter rodentium]|uniref:hypothetical protein n=1 Tax=Xylanibacter rodentium TaxID=2736289 RepID=UPI00258DA35A|nr:hypothetical protein [Xylanibacter rodentium]
MRSQFEVSSFFLAKATGGGAVFRVVGVCRQWVTVDEPLTPIDRNTPVGNAEHRQSATPYGTASGTLPSP